MCYGPYGTLLFVLIWSWGTARIGRWTASIVSCSLPLFYASLWIKFSYFPSNQTYPYKTHSLIDCCPSWVWPGVPNPELFLLGFIVQGRQPRSILVGRSWWGFWWSTNILVASCVLPWVKTYYSNSVIFLLKLSFFVVLYFPYRYLVWLWLVPVPPSCFTWVLFPMVMFLPFL